MRGLIAHAKQVLPFSQAVMSRVVWDVAEAFPPETRSARRGAVRLAGRARRHLVVLSGRELNQDEEHLDRNDAEKSAAVGSVESCGWSESSSGSGCLGSAEVRLRHLRIEHQASGQDLALHLFGQDLHAVLAAPPRFDRLIDRDAAAVAEPAITLQNPQLPALID